jgi:hypothetical protein
MGAISQKKVQEFLVRAKRAKKNKDKGQIFEDLVCYIVEKIPGISVTKRNVLNPYHSEEIDIGIWNEKVSGGLNFLPNTILIEAKNWTNPVGSQEIAHFVAKLEERGLEFGFFVALKGVSGSKYEITAAKDKIRLALGKKIRVIVIKGTDIDSFKSGKEVVEFVKGKLCELAASGTQFD